ncbi:MAG: cupin domain-containing protein [Deltaproteobacteria bacterium]|nr:cupin domain-containing protein [Deltaproteobacteria bacterium]
MRYFIDLQDLSGQPSFTPPGHSDTLNHYLAHQGNGARHLAIWHGCIKPGGEAQEHQHTESDQAFYVLGGECLFLLGGEEHRLGPGNFVFVPQGESHRILSTGAQSLRLLVIKAPPTKANSSQ